MEGRKQKGGQEKLKTQVITVPQLQIADSKIIFCNGRVSGFTFEKMLFLEVETDETVSAGSVCSCFCSLNKTQAPYWPRFMFLLSL